jgi:very-short-patch-repair endonuclease
MPARNIVVGQKVAAVKLQRAKELRRAMTGAERTLWERLRGNRLHGFHFRRQQVIDGFIADFYCHAAGLVVEVDGGVHAQQAAYDSERDRVLSQRGLRVLRIGNEQVEKNLDGVLACIAGACEET